LAAVRVSYGYPRLTILLRREGWHVNAKRVYRLYREEGLVLRRKRPKRRRSAQRRQPAVAPTRANERWTMDFMSDALGSGQRLRVFTLVDVYTRECVALDAAGHFSGRDVAQILSRVASTRGLPTTIACDNGTEFTSRALDQWAYANRVQLAFSRPGKPTDNAMIESFNASVRRECLSEHYFSTLIDAQTVLSRYRDEYNNQRPHSSLANQTPAHFRAGSDINPDRRNLSIRVA
jgi:putative transposase